MTLILDKLIVVNLISRRFKWELIKRIYVQPKSHKNRDPDLLLCPELGCNIQVTITQRKYEWNKLMFLASVVCCEELMDPNDKHSQESLVIKHIDIVKMLWVYE